MVALSKDVKPLGGEVGSDDQNQAAKAEKMAPDDGCMLHPDVLSQMGMQRVDFPEWLSEAKAQLDRSQECITTLTERIYRFCEGLSGDPSSLLLKNFTALKEQIDQDAHDICKVMNDFCFFSSSYHFFPTKQDPVGEGELSAGSEATAPRPKLADILNSLDSLRQAMSHPIPFIQRMRRYYEGDKAVYEKARVSQLQQQDTNFLERANQLYENLTQHVMALADFADLVKRVKDTPAGN